MIDVIGAGLGRTGTLSLKRALEELGFAPCYHIEDTVRAAGHLNAWTALAHGEEVDWRTLFAGYRATSDFPSCWFYREQADAFPGAKVVLTVRDPEEWAHSIRALREFNLALRAQPDMQSPRMRQWAATVDALVWDRLGPLDDVAHLVRSFHAHVEAVKRDVPPERLLVFDVRDGWAPLCDFLGVPSPDAPFPRVNDRASIKVEEGVPRNET